MYYLLDYSLKNLKRNRRRTILTVTAVGLAVFFMIIGNSYFSGIVKDVMAQSVRDNGHLVIQSNAFTPKEKMMVLDEAVTGYEEFVSALEQIPNVMSVSPRVRFGAFFSRDDKSSSFTGVGFDPLKERESVALDNFLVNGTYFTGEGKEVIIGLEIARRLNIIGIGEYVTMMTRDYYGGFTGGKYRVCGIVDFKTRQANSVFYIPLKNANRMLKNESMAQRIVITLHNSKYMNKMKSKLLKNDFVQNSGLTVLTVEETGMFKTIFGMLRLFVPVIFSFFAIIALFTITNTMMMTALERTSEIGVLQALGVKKKVVASTFLIESLAMGFMGSFAGGSLAAFIVYVVSKTGIRIGEHISNGMPIPMKMVIYPDFSILLITQIMCIGVLISFLSGLIPVMRAVRMQAASAIRE